MKKILTIGCAVVVLWSACAGAETYKCVQPDGRATFQDQPCQAGQAGGRIEVKAQPPSADPVAAESRRRADASRGLSPEEMLAIQAANNANAAAEAREKRLRAENHALRCESARLSLNTLAKVAPVYEMRDGQRHYFTDQERQERVNQRQREVNEYCR